MSSSSLQTVDKLGIFLNSGFSRKENRAVVLVQFDELSMTLIICVRHLVHVIEAKYHSHVYKDYKKGKEIGVLSKEF